MVCTSVARNCATNVLAKNHDVFKELCVKGNQETVEQLVKGMSDEHSYNVFVDEKGYKGARRDVTTTKYANHSRVGELQMPTGVASSEQYDRHQHPNVAPWR